MGRHRGHGLLKAVREVAQPAKHRSSSRPNPWPRCIACTRRVPELCQDCGWCKACCLGHDDEED